MKKLYPLRLVAVTLFGTLFIVAGTAIFLLKSEWLSARKKPSNFEYAIANFALAQSIPKWARDLQNPIANRPDNTRDAQAHFHEHCAVCHRDDGVGKTRIAAGMSPEVPDLSADHVQKWTDGELFYIIKNGVRFTGMPGWDLSDDHLWKLVVAVREFGRKKQAQVPSPFKSGPQASKQQF